MYLRCFAADGTPRGPETAYGQKLGYGPTVTWVGDRFLTAYCVMFDMATLGYTLRFNAFDDAGRLLGTEQPLRNSQGLVMTGRMAMGVDLRLAGQGNVLYGKSQDSDAWGIQTRPLWFTLNNDFVVAPTLEIARRGNQADLRWPADAAPFRLQQAADLLAPQWADVSLPPVLEGDHYTLTLPIGDPGFFRMTR
jgi:hypothetical protein